MALVIASVAISALILVAAMVLGTLGASATVVTLVIIPMAILGFGLFLVGAFSEKAKADAQDVAIQMELAMLRELSRDL